ncbi:ubiquitin binding protein [Lichtheimia corymbifera JMRC:FSU:9682]|uniref:Vacuolar protein sorting-associated protein 27 n=1 Tax=Lichtheimia corymbifera JMRC:FSU:9682 TaxID=1263082 RepID=A0A068RML0_9FUNG|nr:ubiquitin binding protein [Lichtheimia corymbifera JMRC:FSU:9682]
MVSLWWGQSALEELIEKATSELLPAGQEDLVLHLEISDQIRSKKVNAKDAMRSLKRRLEHKNPNVQLSTLSLIDTCVKNGGDQFVREVASREFMDQLASMIRSPTGCNPDVKNKILGIIQTWHLASRNNPSLGYISDTYRLLQAEGHVFPPVGQAVDSILLETAAPPEWTDSDVCERCRTAFTMTNRKHHCRQCGKTFCQDCSAKNMPLPHIGIDEEVRVCDGCYIKLKLAKVAKKDALPPLPGLRPAATSQQPAAPQSSSRQASGDAQDETFDEDMKRAIEMSLKEAEQYKSGYGAGYTPSQPSQPTSTNAQATTQAASTNEEEDDPDLAAAIAASLRDMHVSSPPYAPSNTWQEQQQQQQYQSYNSDEISRTEMENIELFSTLIARIHARGGNISNDPQITKLYTQIGALQPKLVKTMQDVIEKHKIVVELHDKMNAAVRAYDLLLEQRVAGAHARASQPYTNNATYYNPAAVASAPAPSPSQYGAHIPATGYDYSTASGQMYPPAPQQPAATTNGYPAVSSSPAASAPQFQPSTYTASESQQPYQQMYPPQPQAAPAAPAAGGYYYPPTPTQHQPYPNQYQMPPGQQQQQQPQQQQPKPRVEESPLIDLS